MAEAAEESPAESWVLLTQATLGQMISKPRLLTDRLRKPPFRFLFDVSVEVVRQTGFGLQDLFDGELCDKPVVPNEREAKTIFLQKWIDLIARSLEARAPEVASISAQSIVCGQDPEWTNYMLQCTAAAAWPDTCAVQQAPMRIPSSLVAPEAPPEPLPIPTGPDMDVEEARGIAAGMDFGAALREYEHLHAEFQSTAAAGPWQVGQAVVPDSSEEATGGAQDAPAQEEHEEVDDDELRDVVVTTSAQPLKTALLVTENVNVAINQAQDLLANIEDCLEKDEEDLQRRRQEAAEMRAHAEAFRHREAAEAAAKAEAEAQDAAASAEKKAAAKAARKAEKEALRAARKAQKEAEEEAARTAAEAAKYPMSKTSALQGPRMVSCVGDWGDEHKEDEYEEPDADPVQASGQQAAASPQLEPSSPDGEIAAALPMSECFTDAILGSDPSPPEPVPDFPVFSNGVLPPTQQAPCGLFEKLKMELKETFVSFLCSAMPESLLRKYQPDELIQCLQTLLRELRKCMLEQELGDILDEEPTTLAEDLRSNFPNDWLPHLQDTSAWALRQKYDVSELVDTLQVLSQTCFEKLTDELGPLTLWVPNSSPLRYHTPPPEAVEAALLREEEERRQSEVPPASPDASPAAGPWNASLGAAPWEADVVAPAPSAHATARAGANAPTWTAPAAAPAMTAEMRLRTAAAAAPAAPAAPPVFNAGLGPALWEQGGSHQAAAPGTTAGRFQMTAAAGGHRQSLGAGTGGGRSQTQYRGHFLAR